jgi:DNA-binding NarL/FixJ family response regulator
VAQNKRIRVLIVDDEDIIRLGLRLALKNIPGIQVIGEAAGGRDGIRQVLELAPDVVLMDIGMPDIDGIETTRQIKSALPNTKIVVLTSHENGEDIFAAFAVGADAYCLKEIATEQLVYAIHNIIDGIAWLDPKIAACVLKACSPGQAAEAASHRLSSLEFEVLSSIVEGNSVDQMLEQLKISNLTLMKLMPQIMRKLAVSEYGIYAE